MDSFEEKACLCALTRIFGFEPKTGLALIERMGCASAVFALDKDGLDELLGPYCRQRFQIRQTAVFDAARELETLEKIVVEEMENVTRLSVPLTVECNYGNNWLEAH